MNITIRPSEEPGRGMLVLTSFGPYGTVVLLEEEIDLDVDDAWTRVVAGHVADVSRGAITKDRVLREVGRAQTAYYGPEWRRR